MARPTEIALESSLEVRQQPHWKDKPLALWAGIECTVNRVADAYEDQLALNGHAWRLEDLDRLAALGIRTLRYPILWERTAPDGLENADWRWADERLGRLRELDIRPIVGLLHHGSGPRETSLLDPEFPEKLADYARAVAERYPWVSDYTPVNEPLTTARFSGLYGLWYPHGMDDKTFLTTLLNEIKGTVVAMRAIRQVNPSARLIQTEDLGRIYSTDKLSYQGEWENHRRWLTYDLLCGRVNERHPLWDYFLQAGIEPDALRWFSQNPCPPSVVGINHYVTSNRFLDDRLERYPVCCHGGNGRHAYADTEAVRSLSEPYEGHLVLLREAYERYRIPVAVTECHLGCSREEQMRWLKECWEAAQSLRADGVAIEAVTVWSVLGAFDWNSLLTCFSGYYEPGAFDLRAPEPRPTAITRMMQALAAGESYPHPALEVPGWWRRPDRLEYPKMQPMSFSIAPEARSHCPYQPLLIIGATGTLGRAFARICDIRGLPYYLLGRNQLDICSLEQVRDRLAELAPWAVINTAGYVRVDEAERDPDTCWQYNTLGAAYLAEVCAELDIPLVTYSSDLVFNGQNGQPYMETHAPSPLNVYGASKAHAERTVSDLGGQSLIIRTSAFFGPWDEHNFVTLALRTLAARETFLAADDLVVSPTYVPDLVHASLDLLLDRETGIWHLAHPCAVSWAELAKLACGFASVNTKRLQPRSWLELPFVAERPAFSALGSERGVLLPQLEDALARYVRQVEVPVYA
jgi:dTDP-4-dehydrorhamnose reductase